MQCINNDSLNISAYTEVLENGLEIHLIPRKGFSRTVGVLNVNVGANDTSFIKKNNPNKRYNLPLGTAHFLEHLMLGHQDGNSLSNFFAREGATIRAFTSYSTTTYLFSCLREPEHYVNNLIKIICNPDFTIFDIDKEKKIIKEELLMYQDNSSWLVYINLIKKMYPNLPISNDVVGSMESIEKIDRASLYLAHQVYYQLNNMELVIVGDFNPINLIDNIKCTNSNKDCKRHSNNNNIERIYKDCNSEGSYKLSNYSFNSYDLFSFGFKGEDKMIHDYTRYLSIIVGLESLFGSGSELTEFLRREKLINNEWRHSYGLGPNYSFTTLNGTTNHIDKVIETIKIKLENVRDKGVNIDDFNRSVKKKLGERLIQLDSLETFSLTYTKDLTNKMNFFNIIEDIKKIKIDSVNNCINNLLSVDNFFH